MFTKEDEPSFLPNVTIVLWNDKVRFERVTTWRQNVDRVGPGTTTSLPFFYRYPGYFVLISLQILQVLKITVSRYGETCVLNRHRSPYTHQNNYTIHVLDLAQNQEVELKVEREPEAESAIIQTCK